MKKRSLQFSAIALFGLLLSACGGGGGGSNAVTDNNVTTNENAAQSSVMSFEEVEPIFQAKCTGCHNSGDNPLAPFSLEGEDRATAFKSAIHFSLDSNTMPPQGAAQLTTTEHAKIVAWATDTPFDAGTETLRVSLIEPLAWDIQPKNRDVWLDHRPEDIECPRDTGFLVEDDELEVRTEFCNYLSLSQQSLLDMPAGTEVEFTMSHSALNFNAPAAAHVALSISGNTIWESDIDIPSPSAIIKQTLSLPVGVTRGEPIEIHLHNHGDNAWTIHSLDAFVPSDQELAFCPTFDSTFEAIQATVFEQAGCANSLCHGEAEEGGLDLRPVVAYDNIVTAPSEGSSFALIEPRKPDQSYLYHKLSAKTFPGSYDIEGAPMPSASGAVSPGQLEAIRLWIEAGAPREGSVGDTLGRGEDEIENLLGVCLPEAEAINTIPLPPPEPTKGVQFAMPPHEVLAEDERELCFAVYEDFRDVIPEEYLSPSRDTFYVKGGKTREDAFTHHNLIYQPPLGVDSIHDPAFGEWTCAGGDNAGALCEPTDTQSCGEGQCRSQIKDSIACRGYGPQVGGGGPVLGLNTGIEKEGFYKEYPSHGIFYWNSHAFNLTTQDGLHHVWRNIYFADDRRFRADRINVLTNIIAATGTAPFTKRTVCRDYVFDQGDGLLQLSSHTHKRGERFFMQLKNTGELIYETFTYDEPLVKQFDPAIVFNSADPAERTMEYCATYNNGVNDDGSFNVETVTRLSRRPENASACPARACVAGNVGAACAGPDDNASCDSEPGAGDGWCDACIIMPGASSDDEMFILLGSKLANHDAVLNAPVHNAPGVTFTQPSVNETFSAGETITLAFDFQHFSLEPPEAHHHDGGTEGDHHAMNNGSEMSANMEGSHMSGGGDHSMVNAGHYHVYLNTEDDSADHLTAWTPTAQFTLPADLPAGTHTLRISLRAPDHHALNVEDRVEIQVE
ncbi:MAG: c-type cytochrome [Halioglobus sp.]